MRSQQGPLGSPTELTAMLPSHTAPTSSADATPDPPASQSPRIRCLTASSMLTAASQPAAARNGKKMRPNNRSFSRFLVSLILQRHTVLLLVPILYFWGMLVMMQQGGSTLQLTSLPSPSRQFLIQQQPLRIWQAELSHGGAHNVSCQEIFFDSRGKILSPYTWVPGF
ncbi:hypothetical protein KP509_31G050000 [Ceratopteris richardii]|uniref:Uncharacterized protein n=1 Tax=Ceratopteris richardii TaxID=49495 RepID=A0A8T2QZ46_CERRI|nr:hypothetical protein KP509_31G050000 [Ceratopteris richardii]